LVKKKKIELLQVLRGWAAIVVLYSHYFSSQSINKYTSNGQMGVAFFFLISGFVLVYSTKERGIYHYWSKRALRLLPLYYLTTVMVLILGWISPNLLHSSEISLSAVIKSLVFIPYWTEAGVYPIYPICWTLTVEVFVYLIYYIAYRFFQKQAGVVTAIVLIVLVILGQTCFPNTLFAETYGRIYMLNFSIGMLCANFLPKLNLLNFPIKVPTFLTLGGCLLFLWSSLSFKETLGWTLFLGLIFVALLMIGQSFQFPTFFVQFGNATYSFYLIHYFVVKGWLRVVVPRIRTTLLLEIFGFFLCIAITTLLSQMSYRLLENPRR
jgi:peptidoglycan/LPS O-acetylase OafA/YrhL